MQQESVPKSLRFVLMQYTQFFRTCSSFISSMPFPFVDMVQLDMASIGLCGSNKIQCNDQLMSYDWGFSMYWNQMVRQELFFKKRMVMCTREHVSDQKLHRSDSFVAACQRVHTAPLLTSHLENHWICCILKPMGTACTALQTSYKFPLLFFSLEDV